MNNQITIEQLCELNADLRGVESSKLRVKGIVCGRKGQIGYREFIPSQMVRPALEKCLLAFNHLIETARTPRDLAKSLAYFYDIFVLRIHPFPDGNGRVARHIIRDSLAGFGYYFNDFDKIELLTLKKVSADEMIETLTIAFQHFMFKGMIS